MKTTDREPASQRTAVRWLAAAAIGLVAGLAFVLLTRAGAETAETTPTTVAETPTTVAETAPTTGAVDPAEAAWQELPVLAGPNPLPPTYRTGAFEPAFSVEIRAGWRAAPPETKGDITLTNSTQLDRPAREEPANGIYFRNFGLGGVEETIQGFDSESSGLVTSRGSTSIGGAVGQLLEIAPQSQTISCCPLGPIREGGNATMLFERGKTYLVHIVDVNRTGVAVIVQAPSDDFESFQEKAQPILDSITWKDLG